EVRKMKKILFLFVIVVGIAILGQTTKPVVAAKTIDTCAYIKDGTILDKFGDPIGLGYNQWGYNYQAHMFNGMYCDAYANADWCQQFKDVSLMMKWNDAWLSNKDCGTQGDDQLAYSSLTTPDNKLDRHYPTNSYIGSGAWLTNHAEGTYTSSTEYHWDVTGNWLLDFAGGTDNREFRNLVQDAAGNVTGEFWWLNGINWEYGGTLVGTVSGDTLQLHYDRAPILYTGDFVGAVGNDVITGGTFSDSHGNNLLWTATGTSTQVYDTCTVSDFVKIVAAPADAYMVGVNWVAANGTEIGPAIWGSFAIIQEKASDPCGEYEVMNYMSPLRKGLGNW
ncbi:MAG: hypothetical protein V1810_01685, partial [Candidatus Beckwithbacteria bacterium]